MRLGHIAIFSVDPEKALALYRDILGFNPTARQGEMIWVQLDDLEILIRPRQPPNPASRYEESATGIVPYTDHRDARLEELQNRGLQIRDTADSDKCFTFTDLDGNGHLLDNPADH